MRPRKPDIPLDQIVSALNARAADVVMELFPLAVRDGREMKVGSLFGEKGSSLSIHVGNGPKAGWWADFNGNESGDMLNLVHAALFRSAPTKGPAVEWAKSFLGFDGCDPGRLRETRRRVDEVRQVDPEAEQKKADAAIKRDWLAGVGGDALLDTPVDRYLAGRGIDLRRLRALDKLPGAIRFHSALYHPFAGQKLPAMVCAITNPQGGGQGIHRTYLLEERGEWLKFAYDGNKSLCRGFVKGGVIPLWRGASRKAYGVAATDPEDPERWALGEGVEDTLSVPMIGGEWATWRALAFISVPTLRSVILPDGVSEVMLLGQNEPRPNPQVDKGIALGLAALRAQKPPEPHTRRVTRFLPDEGIKDINDMIKPKRAGGAVG